MSTATKTRAFFGWAVGLILAATGPSCQSTTENSTSLPAVQVVYSLPTTITGNNVFDDGTLVGRKQVGLQFLMRENTTLKNVVLSHWRAGNNAGAQSHEFTLNLSFGASASQAVGHTAYFEIPGTTALEQCEGLYYIMAATFQVEGKPNVSSFMGQARLILPTKKRVGNVIEQAQCLEPPPPGT